MSPEISDRLIAGEVGLPFFLPIHQTAAAAPLAKVWGTGFGIFSPASHIFLQAVLLITPESRSMAQEVKSLQSAAGEKLPRHVQTALSSLCGHIPLLHKRVIKLIFS